MGKYERLALNREQREVLDEYIRISAKAISVGLYFIQSPRYGVFAYNAKDVNCMNAPANAAYDNGKEEIDITKLEMIPTICMHEDLGGDKKCLVAFE